MHLLFHVNVLLLYNCVLCLESVPPAFPSSPLDLVVLREAFIKSVEKRMMSDVPFGELVIFCNKPSQLDDVDDVAIQASCLSSLAALVRSILEAGVNLPCFVFAGLSVYGMYQQHDIACSGVLLSGGLDSSLVAAIASRKIERDGNVWGKLHSFCVGLQVSGLGAVLTTFCFVLVGS